MAKEVYRRKGEAVHQSTEGEYDQNQIAEMYICRAVDTEYIFEERLGFRMQGYSVHFLNQLDRRLQIGRLLS